MAARAWLTVWALVVGLAVVALLADLRAPGAVAATALLDVATGLAFCAAAAAMPGATTRIRLLLVAVGLCWFVGSFSLLLASAHRGALLLVLLAFPRGRLGASTRVVGVAAAVVIGIPLVAAPVAALVLAGASGYAWTRRRSRTVGLWPTLSGAAVAVEMLGAWAVSRRYPQAFDPTVALVTYELVLLVVAVTCPVGWWQLARARERLSGRLLARGTEEMDGFALVLGESLGDAGLRILYPAEVWAAPPAGSGVVPVLERGNPLAYVVSRSLALEDPETAEAVATAVHLAVTRVRVRKELQQRLDELESARRRILEAVDRQREQAAARVRTTVEVPLRLAAGELTRTGAATTAADDGALAVVEDQLAAAVSELRALVDGIPSARLGSGAVVEAVSALIDAMPLPARLSVDGPVVATREVETTLFYVCAEALSNVVKHAHAPHAVVYLRRVGEDVELEVRDDGDGGADPTGSGIIGLADRLDAVGGRLRVSSPPGAGTVVSARVPLS